jgi:hypothetical protein
MNRIAQGKAPNDRRRYEADFTDALPDGATITTVESVALAGATAPTGAAYTPAFGLVAGESTVVFYWVEGGTLGQTATATITVITSGNERVERTVAIPIVRR